ncbi:MAG: hypothetical protein RL240_1436, partial [Planctomycetota bacterium]
MALTLGLRIVLLRVFLAFSGLEMSGFRSTFIRFSRE